MPYTFEDFERDYALEHLHKLPLNEVLEGIPVEKRLEGLSRKDIAAALRKQLSGLTPEEKKAFVDGLLKPDK